MIEENRRPPLRFRLRTILLVVAILALLLMVVIQQVRIARMRQSIDAATKERAQLTDILREQRDLIERRK